MKRLVLMGLALLFVSEAFAQFKNSTWCFGDSARINFNSGSIYLGSSAVNSRGSCSTISDRNDSVVFYVSDSPDALNAVYPRGAKIYNKLNKVMANGDSIVGVAWYKEFVIINSPNDTNIFFVFTAGVTSIHGLYYSVVDMSQDSGRGAVVQKNITLLNTTHINSDGIAAIKHGNGKFWWVITRGWNNSGANNKFYFFLISDSGIYLHHTQNIGDLVIPGFYRIEPSNNGRKIATCSVRGLISLFDFDRCSGYLSNEIQIDKEINYPDPDSIPVYFDCELSPNNRYLYVGTSFTQQRPINYLFQFDLQNANPAQNRDTLFSSLPPVAGGLLELAPNNKIYWSCMYSPIFTFYYPYPDSVRNYINENLSVINYPDSGGVACDFSPFSFYLGGKRTYYGLPNNSNYELGADSGSVCDTLMLSNQDQVLKPLEGATLIRINPIPAKDFFYINYDLSLGDNALFVLYDAIGNEVLRRSLSGTMKTSLLRCDELVNGVYFYTSTIRNKIVDRGKVVVVK